MRVLYPDDVRFQLEFVERAVECFQGDPHIRSYADYDVGPGCLLALRWGSAGQAVMVLRVDEAFDPVIYGDVLPEERRDG
jgi:hypothetical protein